MYSPVLPGTRSRTDTETRATLQVDVVADFACPWSYLGKRRLDAALRAVQGPVEVRWYPFRLNPDMPPEGMPIDEYLASRFGSADAVRPGLEMLTRVGSAEGIRFHFDRIERMPDTLGAHRLMHLAESRGCDTGAVAESLYQRFFEQGANLSDPAVLVSVGNQHGLTSEDVHSSLENDATRRGVLDQEAKMRKGGVAGVPAFLVNKHLFVSGAQDTEILVSVFDRAMFGADAEDDVPKTLH